MTSAPRPIAPGAGVALVSLFDADGRLLVDRTAELAARIVAAGANSVLVAGTVGEFYALDDAERVSLVRAVRNAVAAPVIAHVGGVPADRAAELARSCADEGADAVIALPRGISDVVPYYADIVTAAGQTPVLAYHLPQAGGVVSIADLNALGVAGIKDSSGDGGRLAREVLRRDDLQVYTGATTLIGLAHALGAAGALLGMANVCPETCAAAFNGDHQAQRDVTLTALEGESDFPAALKRQTAARWDVPEFSRSLTGVMNSSR